MSLSFVEPRRSASRSRGGRGTSRSVSQNRSQSRSALRSHSRSREEVLTPNKFTRKVGFDTFDNKDATDFSLTLQAKHSGYTYTRLSRTFLCGTDQNDYSDYALEWLLEELMDDGDEIVCLRVVDPSAKISSSDSALQEKLYREEAYKLLNEITSKNEEDKKISLILEFAVGKVQDMIQRMIEIYEPAVLIVGTRGKSLNGFQGLLPGSISKYCLQHSPVPVIVVRPSKKREEKKKKRQNDPTRRVYMDIMSSKGASTRTLVDQEAEGAASAMKESAVKNAGVGMSTADSSSTSVDSTGTAKEGLERLSRVTSAPQSDSKSSPSLLSSLKGNLSKGNRSVSPSITSRLVLSSALGAAVAASVAAKKTEDTTPKLPNPEIVIDDVDENSDTDQDHAR